jgi:hypothetical protein
VETKVEDELAKEKELEDNIDAYIHEAVPHSVTQRDSETNGAF